MGRPRKNPIPAPEGVKDDRDDRLAEGLMAMARAVSSLEKVVLSRLPQQPQDAKQDIKLEKLAVSEPAQPITPEKDDSVPIPHEWRDVIDRTLSSRFPARVTYLPNGRFELVINVPKEYSNASARIWEMDHADRRIQVMDNYLGAQGVQIYCDKIAKNLGPDIMAKINDDRAKLINA